MTPKEIARARIEGRARRVRLIRRRIAAGAVGLFSAVWAVIGVQLATGHDPALASKNSSATATTATAASPASGTGSPQSGTGSTQSDTASSQPSSDSSSASTQSSSPVTTRQS